MERGAKSPYLFRLHKHNIYISPTASIHPGDIMARGQETRRARGHWNVGARQGNAQTVTGTILHFTRRGSVAEADVQIDGGMMETLAFDFLDLKAGTRVQFTRSLDPTRPQGARATNVKVIF